MNQSIFNRHLYHSLGLSIVFIFRCMFWLFVVPSQAHSRSLTHNVIRTTAAFYVIISKRRSPQLESSAFYLIFISTHPHTIGWMEYLLVESNETVYNAAAAVVKMLVKRGSVYNPFETFTLFCLFLLFSQSLRLQNYI